MKFIETNLAGAYIIEIEPIADERGFFTRSWCEKEFSDHGLSPGLKQCDISFNKKKGTLRGVHYNVGPNEENKLVRCTSGSIYDLIVDLRPKSATFKKWISMELTAMNRKMLYIPVGFAHGFQTLTDNAEVFYQMSHAYVAGFGRGVRWNDPEFGFQWPLEISVISDQDRRYPNFSSCYVAHA